jgi:hypothetical protein
MIIPKYVFFHHTIKVSHYNTYRYCDMTIERRKSGARGDVHVSATTPNSGTIVNRRFFCGSAKTIYITRITCQLELELRESLQMAIEGD